MRSSRKPDAAPAMQFYVDAWLTEPGLRLCDLAARGLWIEILAHSWRLEDRGEMRVAGVALSTTAIAQMVGRPTTEVEAALKQLLEFGVAEKSDDGCIYCRRMVREEKQRRSKVLAGRAGGLASKTKRFGGSPSPSPSLVLGDQQKQSTKRPSRTEAPEDPPNVPNIIAKIEDLRAKKLPPVMWRALVNLLPPEERKRYGECLERGDQSIGEIIDGQGLPRKSNVKPPDSSMDESVGVRRASET